MRHFIFKYLEKELDKLAERPPDKEIKVNLFNSGLLLNVYDVRKLLSKAGKLVIKRIEKDSKRLKKTYFG